MIKANFFYGRFWSFLDYFLSAFFLRLELKIPIFDKNKKKVKLTLDMKIIFVCKKTKQQKNQFGIYANYSPVA